MVLDNIAYLSTVTAMIDHLDPLESNWYIKSGHNFTPKFWREDLRCFLLGSEKYDYIIVYHSCFSPL